MLSIAAAQLFAGEATTRGSVAVPQIVRGPRAVRSVIPGPSSTIFTCQVVGLNSDATCYDPFQIRRAYNIDPLINAGFDGKGKTIVIIDAFQAPNIVSQLNIFNSTFDLPGLNGLGNSPDSNLGTFKQIAPDGLTPFVPGDSNMASWANEISLDVEWAHAIAPHANIVLVLAKSNEDADILSVTKYAIDHVLGDVISQSFGEDESCLDPRLASEQHQLFSEATLKGITLFASTGDIGAAQASCDGNSLVKSISSPAVDPLVTGVGGTELHAASYCLVEVRCSPAANPLPGTYEGEIAWNETPDFGASGGGFSVLVDKPKYQQGSVTGGKRGLPDVSYSAAVLHGVLVYLDVPGEGTGFFLFGGTSAGSPQWSALIAIADQRAGGNLGFINQALYGIGQSRRYPSSYHDITQGNNSIDDIIGFNAGPGWDAVTGLGSPNFANLVDQLIQTVSPLDALNIITETESMANAAQSASKPAARGVRRPH